jgi:hypothetical protein
MQIEKSLLRAALVATFLSGASGVAVAANALTNSDFSNATITASKTDFAGWAESGKVGLTQVGNNNNSWATLGWNSSFASLTQVFTVSAASSLTLAFDYYLKNAGELYATLVSSSNAQIWSFDSTDPAQATKTKLSDGFSALLSAGSYTLTFSGAKARIDNVVANVAAVPGPIAAAGLPGMLALLGFGLYRRRSAA